MVFPVGSVSGVHHKNFTVVVIFGVKHAVLKEIENQNCMNNFYATT